MLTALFGSNKKKAKRVPDPQTPEQSAPANAQAGIDDHVLVALISAAVAAMLDAGAGSGEPSGFVVRSIRRVSAAPAWGRAGREEQVYSRL